MATVDLDCRISLEEHARQYTLAINGLLETRVTTAKPRSTLKGLFLGPLHVTFGEVSPRVSRRTKALCDHDGFDRIALQWVRSGEWRGQVGGEAVGGGADTMMLFDYSQPFSLIDEGQRAFAMVFVPRALAGRLATDPATLHGRSLDAPDGAMLAGFLHGLIEHPEALRADQASALADLLIELTALAFRTDSDMRIPAGSDPQQWIRERAGRLIEMRLGARDLTPEWIARKLSLSRTELYAAFPQGGVASLIWERRLAAARNLLADPQEKRPIGAIARLLGFASDAHFSRAFKQRYGVAPGAARKAAQP